MALNTSSSIVDFLKARGLKPQTGEKFPFYQTRSELYGSLGMSANLGSYRGTSQQNVALLQSLQQAEKSTGISITSENLFDVARVGMGGGTATPAPLQQTPMEETTTGQATPTQPSQPATAPAPVQPTPQAPAPTAITPPSQVAPTIDVSSFLPQIPSATDVASQALEQVQRGATFPLRQEAVEAEKEAIRLGAQRQKESFIQNIASRGLFFSGAKTKGLQTVEADQLSQILGVDRKFALLIAQGLETAAQDIVKEAKKGRQEAIDSLGALGYAINPITGRIEPTLTAKKAEATQQLAVAKEAEDIRQFEVKEERLQTQAETTQARFETTEARRESEFAQQQAIRELNATIAAQREVRLGTEAAEEEVTKFSDTQLNKGASASGMSIQNFSQLDPDIQNEFISGESRKLIGGRLPVEDLQNRKDEILGQLQTGIGLGEISKNIEESNLPMADKLELQQFAQANANRSGQGFFGRLLGRIGQ